ncbi:hypothetical protein DM01DRAFT_1335309 [Hesseltinella vesiculosa]|uniref:Uncharacterized protein n=1 Tax=Hesseltinella vesiculosa TaxID=101127 RepID=A0A1X2GJ05_9FUNG|nr:hypothetical protein DM01DRAFT_1335309 [Hesseltinella vesiculosa]
MAEPWSSIQLPTMQMIEFAMVRKIVAEKEAAQDYKGAVPFLSKLAQLVDNAMAPADDQQRVAHCLCQADCHFKLGYAFQRTGNYIQAEASLTMTMRLVEKLIKQQQATEASRQRLVATYDLLIECYHMMGKYHLERGMMDRKQKLQAAQLGQA